ncbi:MFS transporter [Algoriphagus zhangzhouensis]|uniref:MFS transporter, PAT family, beta-lactamase induction signal transducer AmpG n=1 Tax=Algoriphagus zhangzhouensis TaxID=1073327 RepID=A0A1M7ZJC4_9BACT|nr:MFS transporter [Algoriphagus zhangzhouensis]TDY43571.1 PAT family beta-lactamase induction signal transducer AmpG [Algoriphagus zhangzhouensis]SHO64994.1 MFS transporter, PAT family, beta-lactamase induction signal transducer AmpG [Algoriphagus zhangzhouensis]
MSQNTSKNPWLWVPPLYLTESIPYVIIITVSVIMYKSLGISNSDIGLYTSFLYLPWVIKPIWSPILELFGNKKQWYLSMQLILAAVFLGVGLTTGLNQFFTVTLAFFWMGAFASATNDIASDGMYLLALKPDQQSFFVGLRSTFYRVGMITGQGLIVIVAGNLETSLGDPTKAWSWTMIIVAGLMLVLTLINWITTPNIKEERITKEEQPSFGKVFATFFNKKNIGLSLAFVLLYRLGESQLVKMASPFFLDERAEGGLGLSVTDVGYLYGTLGVISLLIGGILGGVVISRDGLGKWMMPMAIAINAPNLGYVFLSWNQPESFINPAIVVIIEQLGYGFGFAAYMVFLIYLAEGLFKTAHYALATGFMAMGMMFPGMVSGYIQEWLGYPGFFVWVVIATIPSFLMAYLAKYPKEFGKKSES